MSLSMRKTASVFGMGLFTMLLFWSGLFILWTPFPLLYFSLKKERGLFLSSLASVLALAVLLHFANFLSLSEIQYLAYYLLIALLLDGTLWKKMPLAKKGAFIGLTVTAGVFLVGFVEQQLGGFDFGKLFQDFLQEISLMLDQMGTQTAAKQNHLEILAFIAQTKEGLLWLPKILPSLIFTFTLFVMTLNLGFLRLLARTPKAFRHPAEFHRLQAPYLCIWLAIAGGFLFFLDFYWLRMPGFKWIAVNLFVLVAFVYFFQGLSIMAFFLKRYSPFFRFGIYGLVILFFQMMGFIIVGFGLADTWFDFRKLHSQKIVSS